jgi:hypothetical protein
VRVRPWTVAALCALHAILAHSASAQTGGTPVPGPGDPCPAAYPGDDANQSAIARWMARGAALNAGPYRGFPQDPELQLRWFTDTAAVVRQRRMAEGDEDFGLESSGYGLWIADVERPAPENRDGYQPYLDDADSLLNGSCSTADHSPDDQPPALRTRAARRQRDAITLRVRCPVEPCVAGAIAEPRRRVRGAPAVAVGAEPATLTLAARSARGARLVVTVTAVDESGNATRVQRRVTLLR